MRKAIPKISRIELRPQSGPQLQLTLLYLPVTWGLFSTSSILAWDGDQLDAL
jgi:hypothetical protein